MAICPSNMMAHGRVFPNYAGRNDVDDLLAKELEDAGIDVHRYPFEINGEVKTRVVGTVGGKWIFKRAWYYWVAEGDGIPPSYAWDLYRTNGKDARIDGHCGCVDPSYCRGFAIGLYHVDNASGLKALADTIRRVVDDALSMAQEAQQNAVEG